MLKVPPTFAPIVPVWILSATASAWSSSPLDTWPARP
jgi:hypothetical protein